MGAGDACDVPLTIALSWHRCRDVYRIDPTRVCPRRSRTTVTTPRRAGCTAASSPARRPGRLPRSPHGEPRRHRDRRPRDRARRVGCRARTAPRAGRRTCPRGRVVRARERHERHRDVDRGATGVHGPRARALEHGAAPLELHRRLVLRPGHQPPAGHPDPVELAGDGADSAGRPARRDEPVAALLQCAAARHGRRIAAAFEDLERRTSGALVALDLSGRIVAANSAARRRGAVPGEYAVERPTSTRHGIRSLGHVAPEVRDRTRDDPGSAGHRVAVVGGHRRRRDLPRHPRRGRRGPDRVPRLHRRPRGNR